jgi:tRNA(Ile)-lysidine synthase
MAAPKSSRFAERSPAGDLSKTLAVFLESRLTPGERLCVALSGGCDSVVLLHALCQLDLPVALSALHVHHGLSPDADRWVDFCAGLCQQLGVPLAVHRVDVPRDSGSGLEAAARQLRHAVFAEWGDCGASGIQWLALAHHRDDQAETVLLNLLRGAGIDGAAGMAPERPHGTQGVRLIRPLLDVPRAALAAYAVANGLAWIDDESNADTLFRRNYLRHEIMPRLATRFPGSDAALARAAGHFAEGAGLLADLAALDRLGVASAGRIEVSRFNALPLPRARNLLRHELQEAGSLAPDTRWVDEALRQLRCTRPEAEICVCVGPLRLHTYRGEMYLVAARPAAPELPLRWQGEPVVPWAGGLLRFQPCSGSGLSQAQLAGATLRIRARAGGERLQVDARRPRRTLRNLLQEAAIPPWERDFLPYVWCGETLAWVAGVGHDCRFACQPGEAGLCLRWEADADADGPIA